MRKIGYVYSSINDSYIKEQIEAIREYGLKTILLEAEDLMSLKSGDELVIYELKSLGKTIIQLASFLNHLNEKGVKLTIIKKEEPFNSLTEDQFYQIIFDLAEIDSVAISERTTRGIKTAKEGGRIGGRPKISDSQIQLIKHLYHKQSYTLREIVDKCDVSLGTVYKYIHE
ncbi:recombinase family protein [Vagococcus fluvialis]|uniref:recombinase family protein n=1 Tax=Vagococcus fluvialis TaxID=2738 RepID=UPI001A9004F7|nr:recombinase family protein [Vagococcus fluvialis]MBO0428306.1 recombinase family protein [Vagococcus fluvialis]